MAYSNFCKKCKADVPAGVVCPRCGAKLTKAGERYAFTLVRVPVRDWFSWNAMLRVAVPVIGLVLMFTLVIEGALEGTLGIQHVFLQGFFWVLMVALGILLCLILMILTLQGSETVRYVLDAKGAHAFVYLKNPKPWQFYARLMSPQSAAALQNEAPETLGDGLTFVNRTDVLWPQVKRVRIWPETCTFMLFNPSYWQALTIRCDAAEFEPVSEVIAKKAPRKKRTRRKAK